MRAAPVVSNVLRHNLLSWYRIMAPNKTYVGPKC